MEVLEIAEIQTKQVGKKPERCGDVKPFRLVRGIPEVGFLTVFTVYTAHIERFCTGEPD